MNLKYSPALQALHDGDTSRQSPDAMLVNTLAAVAVDLTYQIGRYVDLQEQAVFLQAEALELQKQHIENQTQMMGTSNALEDQLIASLLEQKGE